MIALWFGIWVFLWVMFFVTDGYDLGLGALLPLLGINETDRRLVLAAIGPFWDGNEVWLIAAGGMTFAAFPGAYAVMFSALYTALMLVLAGLVARGVALGLREAARTDAEKKALDLVLAISSLVLCILFGAAFANIFRGLPIDAGGAYHGSFFTLLNWYGLLGGVFFTVMLAYHGSLWFLVKAPEGEAAARASKLARWLFVGTAGLASLFVFGAAVATDIPAVFPERPLLFIPLAAMVGGLVLSGHFTGQADWKKAFVCSGLFIAGLLFTGFFGIYPAMLPSNLDPAFNVTAQQAASSPLTLKIMLVVAVITLPIIFGYLWWVHRVFSGKMGEEDHY